MENLTLIILLARWPHTVVTAAGAQYVLHLSCRALVIICRVYQLARQSVGTACFHTQASVVPPSSFAEWENRLPLKTSRPMQ